VPKPTHMKALTIVIPARNEELRIRKTLEEYIGYFSQKYKGDFEIIIVMDRCSDRTPKIAEEFSRENPAIRCLNFENELGKGGAIVEGCRLAEGNIVAFADADGSVRPEELDKVITAATMCDGAIGSRWLPRSRLINQSFIRKMASRGFNLITRILFGLGFIDTQCGAKAFRRDVIRHAVDNLILTDFAFDVDLLHELVRNGCSIEEVALTWVDEKNSKLELEKIVPKMLLSLIALWARKHYLFTRRPTR